MTVYCNCSSFDDQEVFLVMILRVRIEIISWNILIPFTSQTSLFLSVYQKCVLVRLFTVLHVISNKTTFGLPYLVCLIFLSPAVDAKYAITGSGKKTKKKERKKLPS